MIQFVKPDLHRTFHVASLYKPRRSGTDIRKYWQCWGGWDERYFFAALAAIGNVLSCPQKNVSLYTLLEETLDSRLVGIY